MIGHFHHTQIQFTHNELESEVFIGCFQALFGAKNFC